MANQFSKQLKQVNYGGRHRTSFIEPKDYEGRVRIAYFDYNVTTDSASGTTAAADTIELVELPQGARIIEAVVVNEDLGTDVNLDVGLKAKSGPQFIDAAGIVPDDPDFIFDGISASTAGKHTLTQSVTGQAGAIGYITEKKVLVYATVVDAGSIAITANTSFSGYVLYVVD